jgi:hypothetical protein
MDSVYRDTFSWTYPVPANIVGIKQGTVYPDSCYTVICAHYDAHAGSAHIDSSPGADDNASGVAAVLEAMRILKNYQFEYNIRFIAFSAEEQGCIGSMFYVWRANQRGDDIQAAFNFDMIGYVDIEPETLDVCGDTLSEPLLDYFIACADTYTTLLTEKRLGITVGDDMWFSDYGYQSAGLIEDYPITNPFYHTQADTIGAGFNNLALCTEVIRAGVAALASKSRPVGISEEDYLIAEPAVFLTVYPNPFRDRTVIRYHFKDKINTLMKIYDVSGCIVKDFILPKTHSSVPAFVSWDGKDNAGKQVPSGVYFLKIKVGDYTETEKLLLIK